MSWVDVRGRTRVNILIKWLLSVALAAALFSSWPTRSLAETLQFADVPLSNPGFEETLVLGGKTVPKYWVSSLWSRTAPTVTGATYSEAASGVNSLYVNSVDSGAAGWSSPLISVAEDVRALRVTFKVKKSTDYAGNSPYVFVSFWNNNSFLGTANATVTGGNGAWTDYSFTVNRSQFSAGTNAIRINLATSRGGATVMQQGVIYYDDVKLEAGMPTNIIDVSNPGFEQAAPSAGKLLPTDWSSHLWSTTTAVDTGVTTTEAASGTNSLYISATQAGAIGWISKPISLTPGTQSIQTSVKAKKSSDYAGNQTWVFISYFNDDAFLSTAAAPVPALSSSIWTDIRFYVKPADIPAGTNKIYLNLATQTTGTGSPQGKLYYDDVSMELVDYLKLEAGATGSWWTLGEEVVFHAANGVLPSKLTTVTGTVYDEDQQTVAQVTVNRTNLIANGWRWTPNREGYFEVVFDYTNNNSNVSIPIKEVFTAKSPKGTIAEFDRDRYAIAVANSQTRATEQRNPLFGFSYQLEGEPILEVADDVGFSFARVHSIPWGTQFTDTSQALEPSQDVFNWTAFDQRINELESYGYEIIGNILYTPRWASSHPEDTAIYIAVPGYAAYAPTNMGDFADFLLQVVNRYGDRIKKWEMWNEPHLPGGSIFWKDTPEKFVELLQTGYETIKSVQPDSEIWIGGLGGRRYLPFYKELLRLGGAAYFDKLSLHGAFPDPRDFQKLDQQYGVASKPWVTSESHAGLLNASTIREVPVESDIAQKMLEDLMYQIKHGVDQITYFDIRNLTEAEVLPFANKEGWFTHASGLFRRVPRTEPRLMAVAMHQFINTLGMNVVYKGEYSLNDSQKAVYLENDGQPLLIVWTDGTSTEVIHSQLAGAYTPQTSAQEWTGASVAVSASMQLKPNRMYFIQNLNKAYLDGLSSTENVLLSDYEKTQRSQNTPTAAGKLGTLFDAQTGVLSEDIEWIDQDWKFQSTGSEAQPQGFMAKAAVGATSTGLDFVFSMMDSAFVQNFPQGSYWQGDSVQFAVDTSTVGMPGGQVEFQAALTASGPKLFKGMAPYIGGDLPSNWTPAGQLVQHGTIRVDNDHPNEYVYKIHVDWSELYPYHFGEGTPLYVSLLANANDGNGRIGYLEWSSGIGAAKDPGLFGEILFEDSLQPTVTLNTYQPTVHQGDTFTVNLGLEQASNVPRMELSFDYDAAKFEYVAAVVVRAGTQLIDSVTDMVNGQTLFIMANIGEGGAMNGNVPLLEVILHVKDDATYGTSTFQTTNGAVTNWTGQVTSLAQASVQITVTEIVNKEPLLAAIASAESLYAGAVEGAEINNYFQHSLSTQKPLLLAAIASARSIADSETATAAQVAEAFLEVQAAIVAFETYRIQSSTGDVNGNGSITFADLAFVARQYGKTSSAANWSAIQSADIDRNGVIDRLDLSFILRRLLGK